jgi:hypothetical protein
MSHPLFNLISQRQETAPKTPAAAFKTSLVEAAPVAAGGGGGGGAGGGGGGGGAVSDPWQVAPGVSILAILDPAGPDGAPGQTRFAPGLTLAERREILFDNEWFAVRVRRRVRRRAVAGDSEECQP